MGKQRIANYSGDLKGLGKERGGHTMPTRYSEQRGSRKPKRYGPVDPVGRTKWAEDQEERVASDKPPTPANDGEHRRTKTT